MNPVSFKAFDNTWKDKLEAIKNLSGKEAGWIRSDLTVSESNWFTRLIWTVVAKFFTWFRIHLYGVDLDKSQSLLKEIGKNLPQDPVIKDLYQQAVLKFNQIAPRYAISLSGIPPKDEKGVLRYVHLIGDSTLDNEYWLMVKAKSQEEATQTARLLSVAGQLKTLFGTSGTIIKNHAYDGFTTLSLLEGDTIGSVLPGGKAKELYMESKVNESSHFVKPLDALKESIESKPNATHYVVLSVGGNDFRVLLGQPIKFFQELPAIQQRYLKIFDEIKKIQGTVQPILMFQYKTVAEQEKDVYKIYPVMEMIGKVLNFPVKDMVGMDIANPSKKEVAHAAFDAILKNFYQPIVKMAEENQVPILDLSQTFDPNDSELYISGIEPSEKGGKLIAEGIHHIVTQHQMGSPSTHYAKLPGTQSYTSV